MRFLLALSFSFLILFTSNAQQSKKGGFVYNWSNYTNDESTGLGTRTVAWDSTGVADIIHTPAIGVHPRVYFGPSEMPDILNRMENTISGQEAKAAINSYATLLNLGSTYNQNASYALDPDGNRYVANSGFWNKEPLFTALINNDPTVFDNATVKDRHVLATSMALEAYILLFYPTDFDANIGISASQRITNLCEAMHYWSTLILADSTLNWEDYNYFGGTHMALCYDFMYNNLTSQQQNDIRAALAQLIPGTPRHGATTYCYANTSNWSTLNTFEIIMNFAIEGETGYSQTLTDQWHRALHTFINYGWYPSGAGYEGLGKNYQFVTTLIACAKRGYSLLAHPHVRAYGEDFLPAITQPFGEGFTSYDVWGGSGYDEEKGMYKFNAADAVGLKWAFPNSDKIDFVWRNYISSTYENSSNGYVYSQIRPDDSYNNYLIPAAVFALDYSTNTWQAQADNVVVNDYVADDRGLAVFRSGSEKSALQVQFHARQDMGGHTHGDRLDFTMSGLERIWIRKSYGGSQFQVSKYHSMVLVDGLGVPVGDPDGDKCRQPATLLNYSSSPSLSKAQADATYAYTWDWHWSPQSSTGNHPWLGNNGWSAVTETWNDFLVDPQPEAHYNTPFYDYGHWTQGYKLERMVKKAYNPMEKVVRNLGLLKGDRSMLLVVDDVKKDNVTHTYTWNAQIARDLELDYYDVNLQDNDYRCDIVLKEPAGTGNRRLLVRVLNNENYDGTSNPGVIETLDYVDYFSGNTYNPNPNWDRKRLVVTSNSISPDFKVLLFPFELGDELPTTVWNTTHDSLSVYFSDEEKHLHFFSDTNGNTDFEIYAECYTNNTGGTCDDNDPDTVNDVYDANCLCKGVAGYGFKVLLEGMIQSNGTMNNGLNTNNLIPLSQPFNTAPWNYNGTESFTTLPTDMVDWVLLNFYDASENILETKAAYVDVNGDVFDVNGNSRIAITANSNDIQYVSVHHKSHLAIVADTDNLVNNIADFTQSGVALGIQQTKTKFGFETAYSGDYDGNGVINNNDFNIWTSNSAVVNMYVNQDTDGNGVVNNVDYNFWTINRSKVGNTIAYY